MANPNGAILDDDAFVVSQRKQRFRTWADGRKAKPQPNPKLVMKYDKSPAPGDNHGKAS